MFTVSIRIIRTRAASGNNPGWHQFDRRCDTVSDMILGTSPTASNLEVPDYRLHQRGSILSRVQNSVLCIGTESDAG